MTWESLYTITMPIVRREKTILKPAIEMITIPIEEVNVGLRTLKGAESEGVL